MLSPFLFTCLLLVKRRSVSMEYYSKTLLNSLNLVRLDGVWSSRRIFLIQNRWFWRCHARWMMRTACLSGQASPTGFKTTERTNSMLIRSLYKSNLRTHSQDSTHLLISTLSVEVLNLAKMADILVLAMKLSGQWKKLGLKQTKQWMMSKHWLKLKLTSTFYSLKGLNLILKVQSKKICENLIVLFKTCVNLTQL